MKPYFAIIILVALVFVVGCTTTAPTQQSSPAATQTAIPNLTGTWITKSEGAAMIKSGSAGQYTHHLNYSTTLTGQIVVTDQQGRVFHAIFTAPVGKPENVLGVISMDNKNVYLADMDGFTDLQIVSDDQMNTVYRQVTANDTVVAVGTWTRVK